MSMDLSGRCNGGVVVIDHVLIYVYYCNMMTWCGINKKNKKIIPRGFLKRSPGSWYYTDGCLPPGDDV